MEDTQERLPVELQAMILSYITEVRHLLPCIQVSKTWKELVDSEEKWKQRTVEKEWPWLLLRQHYAWEPQPSGGKVDIEKLVEQDPGRSRKDRASWKITFFVYLLLDQVCQKSGLLGKPSNSFGSYHTHLRYSWENVSKANKAIVALNDSASKEKGELFANYAMYHFPAVGLDSPIVAHEVLKWTEMWEQNVFWALANQENLQKLLRTGRIPAHLIQDAQRAVSWSFFSRQ